MALLNDVAVHSPVVSLALVALIATAAYILYSRYTHLSHIPGPFVARFTDAWRAYQAYKVDQSTGALPFQVTKLSKYGDVVRIGPNTVFVNDPEAVQLVLGFKERLEKGPGYDAIRAGGVTASALVAVKDEATHSKYRRPVAHSYSLSSLKGYEAYFDEVIQTLVDILNARAKSGEPISMSAYLHYFAFDVISKISFGKSLHFMKEGYDFNGMIEDQKEFFRYFAIVGNWPFWDQFLKRNPVLNYFKVTKPSVFLTFARNIVKERLDLVKEDPEANMKEGGRYPDMLASFMSQQKQYPEAMSDLRITLFSMGNVLAGGNVTALAMDVAIRHFAGHPESWERLHRDLAQANLASVNHAAIDGSVTMELVSRVPYLEAITAESLRLSSVESLHLERVVSSKGMTLPNGMTLPPGTVAALNPSAMMRRADYFGADVHSFNADRWLKNSDETEDQYKDRRARMEKAMIEFGHGSRGCIGKNIAMLEMYKLWATLPMLFKFEAIGEPKPRETWVKVYRRD